MEAKRFKVWFYGATLICRGEPRRTQNTFCDTLTGMSWSNVTVRLLVSQRPVNRKARLMRPKGVPGI
jgi:hypothetical protein